ncbi:MAG: recombinase family protein [Janthinobacterium lividum]
MSDRPPNAKSIGYARVSTDEQSTALQTDALIAGGVAERDIYTDKASGGTLNRPGFKAMFKDLRNGDILVVWKLDRLGRDLAQVLATMERLKNMGVELKVLTQQIDTTTAMGRFVFNIMASLAQMERELGVERTLAGLAAARERGRVGGRTVVLTPEVKAKARELMLGGMPTEKAAKAVGVSRTALFRAKAEIMEGSDDAE